MNNVRDFGAAGDGKTKDTAAIQRAIDAGGMVYFPPGVYLSGSLYLKSDGGLELAPGALLLASPDPADYNADDFCEQNSFSVSEHASGAHFIIAVEQKNIVIRGGGVIDGNREAFYRDYWPESPHKFKLGNWRPGQMVYLCECDNVRISDVEMNNAPYWTCFLHGCEHVNIRGVRIWNDYRTHNGDGIDIDCCRFVTVSDCIIHSGDDCITFRGNDLKLKRKKPCEYVTVTNCILGTPCNAFRVGVGNGIVRNISVSNIVFHDCRDAVGFNSNYSANPMRGVQIENIQFEHLMVDADRLFFISSQVRGATLEPAAKEIRGISFRHVRGTFKLPAIICGCAETGISDLDFCDLKLHCTGVKKIHNADPAAIYGLWSKEVPDCAVYIAHARQVRFEKVSIDWDEFGPQWKYGFMVHRSREIELISCRTGKPVFGELNENQK